MHQSCLHVLVLLLPPAWPALSTKEKMAPSDTAACLPVPVHPLWERTVFNVHSLNATPPHICKVLFLGWIFQAHVYVEPCHPPAMALALLVGPKCQLYVKVATKSHACREAE